MAKQGNTPSKLGIKSWSEEDRPREKLLLKGRQALSNAELLGILISSGTKELSAVDVAKLVLQDANDDLNELGQMSVSDLCKMPGIGEAKAITLIAAIELGRRRKATEVKNRKIVTSKDAFEQIYPYLADLDHEKFFVLVLNRANTVVKTLEISKGGVSSTVVDPKMVFGAALQVSSASSIILCHNHPSQSVQPSTADKTLTRKIVEGGKMLDFGVLDHIIIGGQDYFSFADQGIMPA